MTPPHRILMGLTLASTLAACSNPTIDAVQQLTSSKKDLATSKIKRGPHWTREASDAGSVPLVDAGVAPTSADMAVVATPPDMTPAATSPDMTTTATPPDMTSTVVVTPPDMTSTTVVATPDMTTTRVAGAHHRCGWIGAGDTNGYATFAANATWFDVIHPDWYAIDSDSVTIRPIEGEGDTTLLNAAAANHVPVWPLVAGVENATWVHNMIVSSTLRAQHIQNLVNLAVSKGYVGLDIDYEHLAGSDQAAFSAFMAQLATAMHAAGKQVSVAAGGQERADSTSQWDYVALGSSLDVVHVMGYDFHSVGTHAGPTAPVGWIDSVGAYIATLGHATRFVLGLPNYGVTPTWFCSLADCAAACTSTVATSTTEMTTCPFNEGNWAAGRILNCQSSQGMLFFDDAASLEEKVQTAKTHGLGGVTYWTVGSEPAGFFPMVQKYF